MINLRGILMNIESTNEEKEMSLKNFLLEIHQLDPLENIDSFNCFDVLKISRTEIRHSNVLAWLLDPNENHGFGEKILQDLNHYMVKSGLVTDTKQAFDLLKMDYADIMVRREWKNIDILVESKKEKYVLCIENKVGIKDHSGQLDRYWDSIKNEYSDDYNKFFLYLTPDGSPPKEDTYDAWRTIKYETFIDIIDSELKKTILEPKRKMFIENYLEILRREMMDNAEIVKICQDIYRKHKNALDLIFEYRPDKLQNFYEIVKEWCIDKDNEGKILFDESRSSKSYCRFRTRIMDGIIPDSQSVSGWGTMNHYYYEVNPSENQSGDIVFCLQLAFSGHNLSEQEKEKMKELNYIFQTRSLRDNWQWRIVFKTETKTIKNAGQELDREEIFKLLDSALDKLLEKESRIVKHFNKDIN